jgi:hypothetical protein
MSRIRVTSLLVVLALATSAVRSSAAEGVQYFPSETKAVVTINVKQMLGSALFKSNQANVQARLKKGEEAQKTLEALGFDPLKDLDSIAVSGVGADDPDQVVVVVAGKFDAAKFKAKAEEVAKDKGDLVKVHKAGENTIYEAFVPNAPVPLFAGMVDGKTIVLSPRKDNVAAAFDIKAGKKKSSVSKELQGLLDKSNAKQSLSLVVLGKALPGEVPFGDKVENITGGVTIGDGIETEIAIATKDADSAKQLAELIKGFQDQGKNALQSLAMVQKELAPLAEIVDSLKVSDKGAIVTLKGQVTKEALQKLQKEQ